MDLRRNFWNGMRRIILKVTFRVSNSSLPSYVAHLHETAVWLHVTGVPVYSISDVHVTDSGFVSCT